MKMKLLERPARLQSKDGLCTSTLYTNDIASWGWTGNESTVFVDFQQPKSFCQIGICEPPAFMLQGQPYGRSTLSSAASTAASVVIGSCCRWKHYGINDWRITTAC
jgi:hypothetical protein